MGRGGRCALQVSHPSSLCLLGVPLALCIRKGVDGGGGDRTGYPNAMLPGLAESEKVAVEMEGTAVQGDTSVRRNFLDACLGRAEGVSYGN